MSVSSVLQIRTFSVVRQRFNTLPAKLQEKLIPSDLLKTAADNGPMTPLPRFESLTAAALSQAIDEVNAENNADASKDAAVRFTSGFWIADCGFRFENRGGRKDEPSDPEKS